MLDVMSVDKPLNFKEFSYLKSFPLLQPFTTANLHWTYNASAITLRALNEKRRIYTELYITSAITLHAFNEKGHQRYVRAFLAPWSTTEWFKV